MKDYKETVFSRLNKAETHMNSQQLQQHTQDLHKLKSTKSQHGVGDVDTESDC